MEKFIILKDFSKNVRRFNLRGRTMEFKLKDVPEKTEPVTWVKQAIGDIIKKATEDLLPTDQVAINFGCKDFARGDGWVRFTPAGEITLNDVWDVISSIFQSNSAGLNTETFCLGVTSVRLPVGRGRGKMYNSFQEECVKRKGIVAINNTDNLCLPRALVVAIANISKDPEYKKIRTNRSFQKDKALSLMQDAGVEIPPDGCGIPELWKFQQHLEDYQIVVYSYGTKGRNVIFEGTPESEKKLNLLHHNSHYNVITSCTAAFGCCYYCEACHVPYDHKEHHRCAKSCGSCQQSPPCEIGIKVKCQDCLRSFKSSTCYENHRKSGSLGKSTVCDQIRLCPLCLKTFKDNRKHTCGEIFCKICLKHQSQGHLCYMQSDTGKPKEKGTLYIFYDLETIQESRLEDGSVLHEPNLCVFQQRCEKCINEVNLYFCQMCGFRIKVLKQDVIPQFLNHLLQIRKKFKEIIALAHNGQAFDHQFILNFILTNTDLTPELIMRGTKIILMQLENIKFLDSLNYFPMALSALPKALGLPDNFKKGYFPHLFNKKENQNFVGLLPSIEYYSPDSMKEEARKEFLQWYEEHKNDEFDMQRDLADYCVSDVKILTEACLKFREQMISSTNVCPFSDACTIASACNKVFRRNFLKPNTIGIIPKGGYRYKDNQSEIAVKWLIWEEKEQEINIQHAAKQEEVVLGGFKVDGFCEATKQVFEFQGCYWHGCPNCFKFQRDVPLADNSSETMDLRYESAVAKVERLKAHGYKVIQKWECEFRKEIKENPEINQFLKGHPLLNLCPLNPRDAFYGGRTGNCSTYYKAKKNEKIKYLDVCSLYPWVCKYGKFPVGHPQVFVGRECLSLNLNETDGLIKCKILPPQHLYHPVLPSKMNNKLMFVLCCTCGEQMNTTGCNHTDEERALSGTWVMEEVLKAVEKGYRILEIYEVWKYKVEKYDSVSKSGGLFTEMMNKFIKIKQEASGWPADCVTEEQKDNYIKKFFEREGIRMEFAAIEKNPGLRCLAKLMLNSFWGKLGQQENQPKTKILNKPDDFFNMLTNPTMEVNSVLPINENVVLVNYSLKEESYDSLSTVNVCLAAYTTAQARLKLYSYLEMLEERVLYYDTDSVVFSHTNGDLEPPTGDFIGDMTDELEAYGPESFITEFVSGGPKNYAYKLFSTKENKEKVVCKVKGICLNYNAAQLVNFESIKNTILNDDSQPIKIVSQDIRRTKEHEVVTRENTKLYKPNSLKRKFFADHTSVPYGFKRLK